MTTTSTTLDAPTRRRIKLRGRDEWELDSRLNTFLDALRARGGMLREVELRGRDAVRGCSAVVVFDVPAMPAARARASA